MDIPGSDPKSSTTTSLKYVDMSQPVLTYGACTGSKGHTNQRRIRGSGPFIQFIKAFCIATLVWVLFGKRYASLVRHRLHRYWEAEVGRPDPRDGHVVKCINGAEWTSEGAIYKEAVSPNLSSWNDEALERANVCQLERPESQSGVGIFTPNELQKGRWDHEEHLKFNVTVRFPRPEKDSARLINDFRTAMVLFSQRLDDLTDIVHFRKITLQTKSSEITAASLHAERAHLSTFNAPISGSFNISTVEDANAISKNHHNADIEAGFEPSPAMPASSLRLTTINAGIDADVALYHDVNHEPSGLIIRNTNGPITGDIKLYSHQGSGGEFIIDAKSVNKAVNVNVSNQPIESLVKLEACTISAPGSVALALPFEGDLLLSSLWGAVTVDMDSALVDPSREGNEERKEGSFVDIMLDFCYRSIELLLALIIMLLLSGYLLFLLWIAMHVVKDYCNLSNIRVFPEVILRAAACFAGWEYLYGEGRPVATVRKFLPGMPTEMIKANICGGKQIETKHKYVERT
ncbi:hypothetical protein BD410DRAFT_880469 [Rickenella mellea]|uniref:Uncharacterized protein n=1 Tax=Rickenella mellea TaxID=50990 RepID=A0A4Y7PSP3_9AGAM|nr:hypothetical protein BD410DRAFT_880469 [Rickenella mellea]